MTYSIIIPHYKILHFVGLRKVGASRYGKRQIGHFSSSHSPVGTTIMNTFGEPIHYRAGVVVGCSHRKKHGVMYHYNKKGTKIGYSRIIFVFLAIHHIRKPLFYK